MGCPVRPIFLAGPPGLALRAPRSSVLSCHGLLRKDSAGVHSFRRPGLATDELVSGWQLPSTRACRDWSAAYVLLAPGMALLGLWFIYPIIDTVVLGFQRVNLFHFSQRSYVGLTNFHQLWEDPAFHHSLFITMVFVLLVVPAQTASSLGAGVRPPKCGGRQGLFPDSLLPSVHDLDGRGDDGVHEAFRRRWPADDLRVPFRCERHDLVRGTEPRAAVPRHRLRLHVHRPLRRCLPGRHRERARRSSTKRQRSTARALPNASVS